MDTFKLGISTCPNDTFIFAALLSGFIPARCKFEVVMDDVEKLNQRALQGELDIVKVSYGVLPDVIKEYAVLPAGGALGFGCGPLFVAKDGTDVSVSAGPIAVPGVHTTAFKVFSYFYPALVERCVPVRFDRIMPGIRDGLFEAGLIIHEGRFTYENYGLVKLADMGELWDERFHTPLPLGAILMKRELVEEAPYLNRLIVKSLEYAQNNIDRVMPFISKYSDEMSPEVMQAHIELYVNDYSKNALPAREGIAAFLGLNPEEIFFNTLI